MHLDLNLAQLDAVIGNPLARVYRVRTIPIGLRDFGYRQRIDERRERGGIKRWPRHHFMQLIFGAGRDYIRRWGRYRQGRRKKPALLQKLSSADHNRSGAAQLPSTSPGVFRGDPRNVRSETGNRETDPEGPPYGVAQTK